MGPDYAGKDKEKSGLNCDLYVPFGLPNLHPISEGQGHHEANTFTNTFTNKMQSLTFDATKSWIASSRRESPAVEIVYFIECFQRSERCRVVESLWCL